MVQVVVVPLADDVARGGIERNVSECAQRLFFNRNESNSVTPKPAKIVADGSLVTWSSISDDDHLSILIGLPAVTLNRFLQEHESIERDGQATDPGLSLF